MILPARAIAHAALWRKTATYAGRTGRRRDKAGRACQLGFVQIFSGFLESRCGAVSLGRAYPLNRPFRMAVPQ
jgi:hypothetical protein